MANGKAMLNMCTAIQYRIRHASEKPISLFHMGNKYKRVRLRCSIRPMPEELVSFPRTLKMQCAAQGSVLRPFPTS